MACERKMLSEQKVTIGGSTNLFLHILLARSSKTYLFIFCSFLSLGDLCIYGLFKEKKSRFIVPE